jgi:hypothetical protein
MHLRKSCLRISVVVIVILSAACDFLSSGDRTWSEEVALDDGTVITIDRHVEQRMSSAIGGSAFSATETTSTLAFRGDLAALPQWNVPLMPLLLYRDSESAEWVIVATSTTCEVWYRRGMPEGHYWEFRLRGTEWIEVPLSETSFGRRTNLLFEYAEPLPAKHITLSTKAQLQSGDQLERFRIVQRGVRACAPLVGR